GPRASGLRPQGKSLRIAARRIRKHLARGPRPPPRPEARGPRPEAATSGPQPSRLRPRPRVLHRQVLEQRAELGVLLVALGVELGHALLQLLVVARDEGQPLGELGAQLLGGGVL